MKSFLATLVLVFLSLPFARAGCVAPYFDQTVLTDRVAISLVAADFNGDGKPDVAGITATGAFILRNDGTGKFSAPVDVYSGALQGKIVAGDFNGDGHLDLAFARDGALVVLPGKGDGTFNTPVETATTTKVTALAEARFDSDAALDLVAIDAAAAKLVIFRNSGSGAFTEWQTLPIRPNGGVMTTADLDADGKVDVVVGYYSSASLDVYYGGADGKLAAPVVVSGSINATALRAVDMNGDGLPDPVLADGYGRLIIIRNLGGRSFGDPLSFSVGQVHLNDLTAADVTDDGRPDLVAVDGCDVFTAMGTGTGTLGLVWYTGPSFCTIYTQVGSVITADFDGDGRLDVVASFPASPKAAVIQYRSLCGDGIITASTESPTITLGQSVTISAGVLPPGDLDYFLVPTGIMSIVEGERPVASMPLPRTGASFTIDGLSLGDHTFVADYGGDPQYNPGRSAPLTVHVTTATTSTTLAVDPPAGVYGVSPQLTATVTSSTGDNPTGPIRFFADGQMISGTGGAKAPKATTATGVSSVGAHTFVAEFAGDATHPPSRATTTYVIGKQKAVIEAVTTFAVAGDPPKPLVLGVHAAGYGKPPTGNLTLRIGDMTVGTQPLPSTLYQQFTLPPLDAGRYMFRVAFSGDANYATFETVVPFVIFPASPPSIDARGTSAGVVATWHGPNHIYLARTKPGQPWSGAVCCTDPPWLDKGLAPEVVYLYRSESYDHTSISDVDVAMLFSFSDDPLLPDAVVSTVHVAEVVRAANILRASAGLAAVTLPPVPPSPVRRRVAGAGSGFPASDVTLLRAAINEARQKVGAYPYPFSTPVSPNTTINAAQLQELREAIR